MYMVSTLVIVKSSSVRWEIMSFWRNSLSIFTQRMVIGLPPLQFWNLTGNM